MSAKLLRMGIPALICFFFIIILHHGAITLYFLTKTCSTTPIWLFLLSYISNELFSRDEAFSVLFMRAAKWYMQSISIVSQPDGCEINSYRCESWILPCHGIMHPTTWRQPLVHIWLNSWNATETSEKRSCDIDIPHCCILTRSCYEMK